MDASFPLSIIPGHRGIVGKSQAATLERKKYVQKVDLKCSSNTNGSVGPNKTIRDIR